MARPFQIPGYKIQKKLGEGGMAAVYQGIQEKLNRKVAIKVLDPALLKNETIASRFKSEAATSAKMRHSNIIAVIDVGKTDHYYYMVMEFLEETLKDRMMGSIGFRLKPEEALSIIRPICGALDYAHNRHVVHRDIKTENIMFRDDGTPVLVDFGIARALDSDNSLTRTGMSLGTPFYMSPEQCNAEKLDGRSDFYSLGVVFFEAITGRKPYDGDTPVAVALKHVQDPVPKLPEELAPYQPLIDNLMAKKKKNRVADGKELVKLIDDVASAAGAATLQPATETLAPPPPPQSPPDSLPENITEIPEKIEMDTSTRVGIPAFEKKKKPRSMDHTTMYRPDSKTTQFQTDPGPARTIAFYMKKISKQTSIKVIVLVLVLVVVFTFFYNMGASGGKKKNPQASSPSTAAMHNQSPAQKPVTPEPAAGSGSDEQSNSQVEITGKQLETAPNTKPKRSVSPRRKPAKKTASFAKDDQDWTLAASLDTLEAYQRYKDEHPGGRHVEKALNKISQIKELRRINKEKARKAALPKLTLRSTSRSIDMSAVAAMLQRHKFFDSNLNSSGSFGSKFERVTAAGAPVIKDLSTSLMWYGGTPSKSLDYKKAEKWIRGLNSKRYGGFADWRLPTVDEAASLLRRNTNASGLHIDPAFPSGLRSIRTGDKPRVGSHWLILLNKGIVYADSDKTKHQVLPVRSIN